MKKIVLFIIAIAVLMIAIPAFAGGKIEWKSAPATDEEKAVAKVVESFVNAHGGSYEVMAELLIDNAKACCFSGRGVKPLYEGKVGVAMFYTARSLHGEKRAYDLVVLVNDGKAEVSGEYDYTIDLPGWQPLSFGYQMVWKISQINGSWKIYEIVARQVR